MVRVETVLDSWKTIRQDTAAAVEEMPEEDLDFRPAPEMLTFRETARHILESGHILTGLLLDGETDFTTPGFRSTFPKYIATLPETPTREALSAALREYLERRTGELAAQPATWFAGTMKRFDGQQLTRLEMLQWTKEHELTHRSQLFMCQRLKGIVPVTTRRRQAAKPAQ
jgi:uncharacterized damage-inducible protein DinB